MNMRAAAPGTHRQDFFFEAIFSSSASLIPVFVFLP
jgi:hypothetical protein